MKVEIDITKFGDYGLLYADLLDALQHMDHEQIEVVSDCLALLARQKTIEKEATVEGVVKSRK